MEKNSRKISAVIRAGIETAIDNGVSRYAISKATGVSESILLRWLSKERGISVETQDKLADYLGLELRPKKRKQ